MKNKFTAEKVAKMFNAPISGVKALYAANANELRESAVKAGAGKYRGFDARWYIKAAEHAESQAK